MLLERLRHGVSTMLSLPSASCLPKVPAVRSFLSHSAELQQDALPGTCLAIAGRGNSSV